VIFHFRINPLSFIEIILHVKDDIQDPAEAVTFLERTNEKVKDDVEARILCNTAIGMIKKQHGSLNDVKTLITETGALLDTVPNISFIHAQFFNLSSEYYATISSYADYYRDALRYLGCMELTAIPIEEQKFRAFKLGLAALLGDGVYNFGELLAHPVLESLRGTESEWLIALLFAFNSG
jgi:26S proteasome regulatory subunit N9